MKAIHFVGFKGNEFNRAQKVFGPPTFVHRFQDHRLEGDIAPGDIVVFANGAENKFHEYTFDDSQHF